MITRISNVRSMNKAKSVSAEEKNSTAVANRTPKKSFVIGIAKNYKVMDCASHSCNQK